MSGWPNVLPRPASILALVGLILHTAYVVWVGGDFMPFARFFVPTLPLLFLFASFGADDTDRSIVTDTLRDLESRGVRMAVVTNNVREFSSGSGGGWRSIVPIDVMSVVVDSSALGMRKPDPAIYHHVLDELGVVPAASVFVDDMAANVAAARAVGMHGVVVGRDPVAAMAELRNLVAEAGGVAISSP